VAPPYPGAWTVVKGKNMVLGKARLSSRYFQDLPAGLAVVDNVMFGVCGDGRALVIHQLLSDGKTMSPAELQQLLLNASI
jgi:methionyl-tRNA formyltransferase